MPDIYVPLHANLLLESPATIAGVAGRYQDRNYYWIEIMGRLNPGVSLAQAQAVLAPQFHRFADDSASNARERSDLPELVVTEGATGLDGLRRHYSKPVFVLMGMAGLILLVACANIANLLLARATARRREIAVRLSMGASRLRLIGQLLTESVLLALLGGALGVAVATWGIHALTLLLANSRDNFTLHAEVNWAVLNFTVALSVLTGLLFGIVPAIQATKFDVMPALKQVRAITLAGQSHQTRNPLTMGRSLVIAQITLSFLLLVAGGLFSRTLSNLHAIKLGFNREGVLLFTIKPQAIGYSGPALNRLYSDLQQRLNKAPGIRNVSLSVRPLPTGGGTLVPVVAPGAQLLSGFPSGGSQTNRAGYLAVGPAFFETMQVPVTAGREFNEHDVTGSPLAAIVNERLVKSLGMNTAVGRTVAIGKTSYQIVGVVGDTAFMKIRDDPRPMIYVTYLQNVRPPAQMTYELRTLGNPLRLTDTVRQTVRQFDSRLAISGLETQQTHIDQEISQEITLARLCTVFAVLALLIACVGLYGTVAYNVERQTCEIGIRVALGAQRPGIVWMILREVLTLALVALAIGIPAVLAAARTVKSLLYGIPPNDPVAIVFSAVVLLMAGWLAAYLPARCASRIDPMIAVRHE